MIASVSFAARESFFGSTDSRASSQARSFAVRKVHLPAMRIRLTPRGAYSACRRRGALFAVLAQEDRPERGILMHVEHALAHHLEHRGKARRHHGRAHRRL